MKPSLSYALAISLVLCGLAAGAYAQQLAPAPAETAAGKNGPCMSEHQTVIAQCKNGDPCGAACKQAHKATKACRVANHLPMHPKGGVKKPSPCKTTGAMPPAGAAPVQPAP